MEAKNKQMSGQRTPGRAAIVLVVAGILSALAGCAGHERVVVRETVVVQPSAQRQMPPPVKEDQGAWPGQGWEWVPGHWKWEGSDWLWIHGKWVRQHVDPMPPIVVEQITVAPSPRHYWVPGHWIWRFDGHGGWVWIRGGWRL